MSKYTTGELAKLCNVSVRTVQFYDTRGLLPPAALTEGGRRLYTDDDLLRLICMLKALGLTLDSIQGILNSEAPGKVLTLLLDVQAKQIGGEMKEKQAQLDAIKIVKERIRNRDAIPAHSIIDIEHMVKNKKGLRRLYGTMIAIILTILAILSVSAIVQLKLGIRIPLAAGMLPVLPGVIGIVGYYYKKVAYTCAECGHTFRPNLGKFLFSSHTPKTRKLKCEKCGHKGYCVEVLAK